MRDEVRGEGFLLSVRRDLPREWGDSVPGELMVAEALGLAAAAEEEGLPLRIFGGIGVHLHSLHSPLAHLRPREPVDDRGQTYSDLDFTSYWPYLRWVEALFASRGYPKRRPTLGYAQLRQIYYHPRGWFHVDVVYDNLTMNHDVPFRGRLELDAPTVDATDLLLSKLQIVHPSPKDVLDCLFLLTAHPLASDEREAIDLDYLEERLMARWGFWYAALGNLRRTIAVGADDPLASEGVERARELLHRLTSGERSLRWRARALVGYRVRWYRQVEGDAAGARGFWR